MSIQKPQDLFTIQQGDLITKRNLYDLIQYSKIEGSEFYGGKNVSIGNTPQQGINWIGSPPDTVGVIIKTRPGSYEHDGWVDGNKDLYRYSFKARKGNISYKEKANDVLIKQPQHLYPILLFTESEKSWLFEGTFELKAIMESFVILQRIRIEIKVKESTPKEPDDQIYQEGDRRYVTHLMCRT
jgi:putative restriction endonuclease